jgi:hypothetical protein
MLIVRYEAPAPKKKIPDFGEVLIREEGPGILNWAIKGLRMLLIDIAETGDIRLTPRQAGVVDSLLAESDSLRYFLRENVVKAPGSDLSVGEIVEHGFLMAADRDDRGPRIRGKGHDGQGAHELRRIRDRRKLADELQRRFRGIEGGRIHGQLHDGPGFPSFAGGIRSEAALDPEFEVGDHRIRQFVLLRRHRFFIANVGDGSKQRTVLRKTGDDGRPRRTASLQRLHRGDIEPSASLPGPVAIGAMLTQQREDVVFEIARFLGMERGGEERRENGESQFHSSDRVALSQFRNLRHSPMRIDHSRFTVPP